MSDDGDSPDQTESLSVKVTEEVKSEFRVAAAEENTTMSDLLRTLVTTYLETRGDEYGPSEVVWDTENEKAAIVTEVHPPDEPGDVSIAYLDSLRKYDDLAWDVPPHGALVDPAAVNSYRRNADALREL